MSATLSNVRDNCVPGVRLPLGSTAGLVERLYLEFTERCGLPRDEDTLNPIVHVDHSPPATSGQEGQTNQRQTPVSLPAGTTIEAKLPGAELFEELEAAGELSFLPPEYRLGQGVGREGLGTGNDPRTGALMFKGIRKKYERRLTAAFRQVQDYQEQWRTLRRGNAERQRGDVPTVWVTLSTAGGMGTGCLPGCLYTIQEVSAKLGICPKIVVICLGLGTLQPPNPERARANQESLLKWFAAAASGELAHNPFYPHHQGHSGKLFDSLIVLTNTNTHGEINSFEALQRMAAQILFLLTRTPVGAHLRENIINIENGWDFDRHGAPKMVSTTGLSVIHADQRKSSSFFGAELAHVFLSKLGSGSDTEAILDTVTGFVRSHSLVETDDEAMATDKICALQDLGGVNAAERARQLFRSDARELKGYEKCLALEQRLDHVLNTEIPANLASMIRHEASRSAATFEQILHKEEQHYLRQKIGVRDCLHQSQMLAELIAGFDAANKEKLSDLTRSSQPIHEQISQNREQLRRIGRCNRFVRWLYGFTLAQIARDLEIDGEEAITMAVEMGARQVLATDSFPKLQDILSQRISRLTVILAHVNAAAAACQREADRQLGLSPLTTAPVGLELMDEPLLMTSWSNVAGDADHLDELCTHLFTLFLDDYGSLSAFSEAREDELFESILDKAQSCFVEQVKQMEVTSVLRKACPTDEQLRAYLLQCLQESQGRIRFKGGIPDGSNWIKVLAASDVSRARDFLPHLTALDTAPGEWIPLAVPGDEQAVYFLQYAAGLSLRALVDTDERAITNGDIRRIAVTGPDPVTALLPSFRPRRIDGAVGLVKAWALGALDVVPGQGVFLAFEDRREHLGDSLEEAVQRLTRSYLVLVKVSVRFASRLDRDPEILMERVASLRKGENTAELRKAVGRNAVGRVMAEARELHRYFRKPVRLQFEEA